MKKNSVTVKKSAKKKPAVKEKKPSSKIHTLLDPEILKRTKNKKVKKELEKIIFSS